MVAKKKKQHKNSKVIIKQKIHRHLIGWQRFHSEFTTKKSYPRREKSFCVLEF